MPILKLNNNIYIYASFDYEPIHIHLGEIIKQKYVLIIHVVIPIMEKHVHLASSLRHT